MMCFDFRPAASSGVSATTLRSVSVAFISTPLEMRCGMFVCVFAGKARQMQIDEISRSAVVKQEHARLFSWAASWPYTCGSNATREGG